MPVLAGDEFQVTIEESRNPVSGKPFGLMLEAPEGFCGQTRSISAPVRRLEMLCRVKLISVRALKCGAPYRRSNSSWRCVERDLE